MRINEQILPIHIFVAYLLMCLQLQFESYDSRSTISLHVMALLERTASLIYLLQSGTYCLTTIELRSSDRFRAASLHSGRQPFEGEGVDLKLRGEATMNARVLEHLPCQVMSKLSSLDGV